MIAEEKLLELRIPAKAERLGLVRAVVKRAAEMAGCNSDLAEQLVIAVNEASMNVIQHAYKDLCTGDIVLEILSNGSQIRFKLVDFAAPIDLKKVKPRDLEDIRPGGLGVHFISEIMDEVRMGHLENGSGNFLEMKKTID
jgi:sigma-B regulation protein RsbU (phosphoserine phosphatase)